MLWKADPAPMLVYLCSLTRAVPCGVRGTTCAFAYIANLLMLTQGTHDGSEQDLAAESPEATWQSASGVVLGHSEKMA